MHPLFAQASSLAEGIIAGAIGVHKDKGPGLVESIYEWCLTKELTLRQLRVENQRLVSIFYKGFVREEPLRVDLLVESCVLIEIKSIERILPIHNAQLLRYMKLLNVPVGLPINFDEATLTAGVSLLILPGSNL